MSVQGAETHVSEGEPAPGTESETPRKPVKPRRRLSVVGVAGELLITAGVLVLLYIGWQVWLNDIILGNQYASQARSLSQKWDEEDGVGTTSPAPKPSSSATADPAGPVGTTDNVPVGTAPTKTAEVFAALIIPRFNTAADPNFYRPIAQGVSNTQVLQKKGIGHYPGTSMPGAVGNFAIASHRTAYGGALHNVPDLRLGDHIYVETQDGWYQYGFRNLQYMPPTEVQVLEAVPEQVGVKADDGIITMTTCNPLLSTKERMAAYGVFESFYPRAGGPPAEIAATVQAKG
jgi:sortase A